MILEFIEISYYLLLHLQDIRIEDPIWIFIIISDNINMLKPQFPLVSMGNSFSWFQNGKYMNIGNMKIFLGISESTSNILSIMKQSKTLLHIDNPYGVVWPLSFSILFNVGILGFLCTTSFKIWMLWLLWLMIRLHMGSPYVFRCEVKF